MADKFKTIKTKTKSNTLKPIASPSISVTNSGKTITGKTGTTDKYGTAWIDKSIADNTAKVRADAATQKAQTNATYDDQLKEAYVNRMQNQRTLANNLAQAGIRGGASETANLKLATTYENSRNNINKSRNAAISDIDKQANDAIYNWNTQMEATRQETIAQRQAEERQIAETKRQEQWQAQQTKKANDETRYAATISGWNNIKKINKEIKRIRKSGKNTWRIKYLRAQRAVLQAKKKKNKKKK